MTVRNVGGPAEQLVLVLLVAQWLNGSFVAAASWLVVHTEKTKIYRNVSDDMRDIL